MISPDLYIKTIAGKGKLNFILIHNAGGNHNMFSYQVDCLLEHGNVILLDLPGHGKSNAENSYTINDSSLLISTICHNYALDNICIIGLNNGANIAINTAYQHQLPLVKMILIDPPLFLETPFINEINFFEQQLETNDKEYASFIDSLINALFIKADPATKKIPHASFMQADKDTVKKMFQDLIAWDQNAETIVASIKTPSLCILTDEHHCCFHRIKKAAPQWTIGKVIGSKCWPTLEVPQQVNAMIERFLIL